MSRKRRLVKTIKKNFPQFSRNFISAIKKKLVWLLRTLFLTKKRTTSANAGFVLPTVAMVSVVVVVLTTAILFRSFDRAQNASNVRVNSAVLSAATPAIDRGRAKLNKLFQDTTLPRSTPTDDELYDALTKDNKLNEYTFGDETPIRLTDPGDSNNTLDTAWRFPVDSDNNGKFDSYTLYGIYFKTPPVNSNNKYERARNTLEARTSPMVVDKLDPECGATIPSLIGDTGWVKQNNELTKSFFVYTATVPITIPPTGADAGNFEKYNGNTSFATVEYQQDRIQDPNSYAVIYNDDLIIDTEANFNNKLNASVFTNSNILNSSVNSGQITLYQVSSLNSCVYKAANSKITVGGNVALSNNPAQIHLFQGKGTAINNTNLLNSVTNDANSTAYNNRAYEDRIQALVNEQIGKNTGSDPTEVTNGITRRKQDLNLGAFTGDDEKFRREQLEFYFRKRTRRVPFAEVAEIETISGTVTQGSGDTLRPIDKWMYPTGNDGKTGTGFTTLALNTNGVSLEPKATEPDELKKQGGKEQELGDRVLVGNNLPEIWWDPDKGRFVGPGIDDTEEISDIKWNKPAGNDDTRTRRSAVKTFDDNIAFTERDGEWEVKAVKEGGLRVVTGAGIYLNANNTVGSDKTIWPDTKPVPGSPAPSKTSIKPYWLYTGLNDITGINSDPNQLSYGSIEYVWENLTDDNIPRLQMRATAVYGLASTPICVSSYYVPTNSTTAKNRSTLPDTATNPDGTPIIQKDTNGLSNNGIVYGPLTLNSESQLQNQADLTYPNGRSVDDGLLKRALAKTAANRTLAEQSAIDAQLCALQILNGGTPNTSVISHGAIREIAFLDPREVEQNSDSGTAQTYDMPIKDRKPVEIRATVLNLGVLPLPKSGLIYATRNDALPDDSAGISKSSTYDITNLNLLDPSRSPVDYKLDPTRRPNGIMLENGAQLWGATYDPEEKGFVLATNLPAYIKGDFNLHTQGEEFTQTLDGSWSNFYTRSTINEKFACRNGDPSKPGCTASDTWRPAAVIADAVTVVSNTFREGFRDEGDYDWTLDPAIKLQLQSGKTLPPGFSEYNNFVNFQKWYEWDEAKKSTKPAYFSSYLNNFVTPINMRARQGPYLTEACIIPDGQTEEEACADPLLNWQMVISNSCNANTNQDTTYFHDRYVNDPSGVSDSNNANRMKTGFGFEDPDEWGQSGGCFSGQNVVRRIAFLRDKNDGTLALPLKVLASAGEGGGTGTIQIFEFGSDQSLNNKPLQEIPDADDQTIPWLNPTTLEPILQIKNPFATFNNPANPAPVTSGNDDNKWLQPALNPESTPTPTSNTTTVNAVIITRDSPANATEKNGGLLNLVRYIENWHPPAGLRVNKINGTLGQVKKSLYATAPFTAVNSGTNYGIALDNGARTGYIPPARNWGYDVGLLTPEPDLLSEKMPTTPSTQLPDEYFREVSRSDKWVETLMCAKDGNDYAIPDPQQRPAICN
ncbi:hormogonium polysaccharide biosynthesis protein HpsA [Nodularia spumigena CS-588/02]|uniref:hormogonium polysaccharide biosynthesis protein HpsA n=1 Tax=Nodularia spumigena TaxID=70799 RepID=UPI00232ABA2A|nr:hormogonium polysaccharide biosynthesis protein HpsA [Nodularia spumigena]MDB9359407.1 hormogonium polysaccharide biosynthesis protein HpsA [Nodularia spumigena CS-588/02]MDB9364538.1 hormogonium polysaccharide biosynthesis protein HpsA [Nodularia spumigena CS-588/02A10]